MLIGFIIIFCELNCSWGLWVWFLCYELQQWPACCLCSYPLQRWRRLWCLFSGPLHYTLLFFYTRTNLIDQINKTSCACIGHGFKQNHIRSDPHFDISLHLSFITHKFMYAHKYSCDLYFSFLIIFADKMQELNPLY